MLALSLLLSAAAGVNAILGGEVSTVKISETSYICADACAYEGVFFARKGHFCPEKETTIRVNAKGKAHKFTPYDCTGAKPPTGYSERQRSNGEEPPKCDVMELIESEPYACTFNKNGGGEKVGKIIQWSDVEKELKSATSECRPGTPEDNQPAAPKSQQQCEEVGRQTFFKCQQNSGERDECYDQSREAFKDCMGLR